ncbi:MAG TPA: hypothetical protein VI547_00505 [Anaerolineales bacterium]|nr:hypothetical protein [Anaerolineales bacterium]
MVEDERAQKDFGCEHCWPVTPDAAWEARRALVLEADLIDESHFHVMILVCRSCAQRFVSVFTETIDWADSDDPQSWALLPITGAEAAELVQQRGSVTETQLIVLGPERRCLRRDYPKAAAPRAFWGAGLRIPPHD